MIQEIIKDLKIKNTMVTIKLTWPEVYTASNVALMRRIGNMKLGIKGKYGAPEKEGSWEPDFMSCQGEMSVAKYTNLFWSGSVGNFDAIDVGGLVEIRARSKEWHSLILHPADEDNSPFVLVHSKSPYFDLVGWCFGHEGKKQGYWLDPAGNRPAFFVPNKFPPLRPMKELLVWIEENRNYERWRKYLKENKELNETN